MDNNDIESVKSLGVKLQQLKDHALIVQILEDLQFRRINIETLKQTRIGIIVNKLTKRDDLSSKIHKLAWKLVDQWKKMANQSIARNVKVKPTELNTKGSNQSISSSSSSIRNNRKRSLSTMMMDEQQPQSLDNDNSNNSNNSNKKQKLENNHNNHQSAMFQGICGNKKSVPSLQSICITVMKKKAMQIGKIPCELHKDLILQIYGNCRPSELKKVYKENPHFRKHLDLLWKRQLMSLNPEYKKNDKTISWFKAYQLYLIEKKNRKQEITEKLQRRKNDIERFEKKSQTKTLSRDEAQLLKSRYTKCKKYKNKNQIKRNRMMADCKAFVQRRNAMFSNAAYHRNKASKEQFNRKQQFLKRQREIREKRRKEKNSISSW